MILAYTGPFTLFIAIEGVLRASLLAVWPMNEQAPLLTYVNECVWGMVAVEAKGRCVDG